MKISKYKYEKVKVSDVEFDVPQEPIYLFETGVRRSIRIVPGWTIWQKERFGKPEEIWKLDIVCVYLSSCCKIEKHTVQVSQIESIINSNPDRATTKDVWPIMMLLLDKTALVRTKEQFDNDLDIAISQIKGI